MVLLAVVVPNDNGADKDEDEGDDNDDEDDDEEGRDDRVRQREFLSAS